MGNKKWIFFIVGGIFIVFIICIFLIPNTIRMEEEEWEYLVVGCLTMLVKVKEVKTLTVDSKDSTSIRNSC